MFNDSGIVKFGQVAAERDKATVTAGKISRPDPGFEQETSE
jgi:hypothetical protein